MMNFLLELISFPCIFSLVFFSTKISCHKIILTWSVKNSATVLGKNISSVNGDCGKLRQIRWQITKLADFWGSIATFVDCNSFQNIEKSQETIINLRNIKACNPELSGKFSWRSKGTRINLQLKYRYKMSML